MKKTQRGIIGRACTALALAVVAPIGCHAHVPLDAPGPTAPGSQRVNAWDQLRGISYHETHITYVRGGVTTGAERTTDYLQLANGERVYHPEDLRPVVGPASPTGRSIDDYESSRDIILGLTIGGVVGLGAGAGITIGSFAANTSESFPPGAWVGIGVATVSAILLGVSVLVRQTAADEKASAFETYNASLAKQLNLCSEGDVIFPCDEGRPSDEEAEDEPKKKKKKKKKKRKDVDAEEGEETDSGDAIDHEDDADAETGEAS